MKALQPLNLFGYAVWLREHVSKGGAITHVYDYPYANLSSQFCLAVKDFSTGGERGADAMSIVPAYGARRLGGDLGHNQVLPLDGSACPWVPVFSDEVFDVIPGVPEARVRQVARDRAFAARQRAYETDRVERARYSDVPRRSRNW